MRFAIIGGGFFGIAAALEIKKKFKNAELDLFEKKSDLLLSTSGKNQFRCHMGYHYPRSKITIRECLDSYSSFKDNLSNTFLTSKNYYAISKKNSKINFNDYLDVLSDMNLKFDIVKPNFFKRDTVQGVIEVPEKIINISKVRNILKSKLYSENVNVFYNVNIKINDHFMKSYDHVVLTTYSENNENIKNIKGIKKDKIFYQLVEKIVVKPPKNLVKKSIVILDGSFFCIDPYETKNLSILGSVKNSVIKDANKIYANDILQHKHLDKYLVNDSKNSQFKKIKSDFCNVFKNFEKTKYFKSFYTIRSTYKNKNDDRITKIIPYKNLSIIHSGKWINCFMAGKKLASKL